MTLTARASITFEPIYRDDEPHIARFAERVVEYATELMRRDVHNADQVLVISVEPDTRRCLVQVHFYGAFTDDKPLESIVAGLVRRVGRQALNLDVQPLRPTEAPE